MYSFSGRAIGNSPRVLSPGPVSSYMLPYTALKLFLHPGALQTRHGMPNTRASARTDTLLTSTDRYMLNMPRHVNLPNTPNTPTRPTRQHANTPNTPRIKTQLTTSTANRPGNLRWIVYSCSKLEAGIISSCACDAQRARVPATKTSASAVASNSNSTKARCVASYTQALMNRQ